MLYNTFNKLNGRGRMVVRQRPRRLCITVMRVTPVDFGEKYNELRNKLMEVGVSTEQADVAVASFVPVFLMSQIASELLTSMNETRTEMREMKAELKAEIADVKKEIEREIVDVKKEIGRTATYQTYRFVALVALIALAAANKELIGTLLSGYLKK